MFLYDPRYNLKTKIPYNELIEIAGMSKNAIYSAKSRGTKIKNLWYILDDDTSTKDLKKLYEKETFENETWKIVEGSDNKYLISNYGRFKRIFKSNALGNMVMPYFKSDKGRSDRDRKQFIKVKFRGKTGEYLVSRLVAYHFVEIYEPGISKPKYKNYNFEELTVYHKNGILYDNYHFNLEFLDREDLGKKTGRTNRGNKVIVAIDVVKDEIVGEFKSTRHVEANLPVSKQAVCDSLNNRWRSNAVGGRYAFKYLED